MTPKTVVDYLEVSVGFDGGPRSLVRAIEECLHRNGGLSGLEAAERAERIKNRVAEIIVDRSLEAEARGTVSVLQVVGSMRNMLAGYSHKLSSDSPDVSRIKQQRRHAGPMLSAIRNLSFSQFERFGARTLKLLGADARITPHSNDQGIDFFGHLTLGQFSQLPSSFMRLAHDVRVVFAGQAKHFPERKVGTSVVRELVGSVSLASSKIFSRDDISCFDHANFRPYSPIVILLFTTGEISSGAADLAKAAGIVAKTGEQLAVFLADNGIGMRNVEQGREFDQAAFDAWIDGHDLRPGSA